MPHDDLTADDVLDLIDAHLHAATQVRKKSEFELGFVLYDAFAIRGSYGDYGRGNWGFRIELGGDATVSRVLGRKLTLCGTRDAVLAALETIDGLRAVATRVGVPCCLLGFIRSLNVAVPFAGRKPR